MHEPSATCENYRYYTINGNNFNDPWELVNFYVAISYICCSHYQNEEIVKHKVEEPIPWIGIYVAVASLVCSFAMAADVFHGFRNRKLWFPCNYFTLNAASLTLLAVAMKLPVDLSTEMPTQIDQLVKLSSTALMSTAIGNFMPSLGAMDDKDILMNMIALAILVITIIVNVCIQLSTRVINAYFISKEHIAVLSFMFILLLVLSFSALTISTTKKCLQLKYDNMHKQISSEESEETEKFTIENFKVNVKRYWMMAKSGSPQFVMARSVTCYASGAICFLVAFTLAEAHIKIFIYSKEYMNPRNVGSSYNWSTFVILVIQSFGVVVGTIAPTFRLFNTIRLRRSEKRVKSYKTEFKTENYWIERLVGWKERPLDLQVRGQRSKVLVHNTKNLILDFCIGVQIVIVWVSKLIMLISLVLISQFLSFGNLYNELKQKKLISKNTASSNHTGSESVHGTELDLSHYVLYLEGEEELPLQIVKNNRIATEHFFHMGKKQQPKYLKELLEKSVAFKGVARFDSNQVPSLNFEEPPNCWSLPVVTLTSIAIALPNIENHKVKGLLRSVSEGLLYANLVEKFLNARSDMLNIRNAADIVWLGVDVFHKWLDEDLQKITLKGNNSTKTLEKLRDIAKNSVIEFKENVNNGDPKENPLNWPIKVIAANSMYRISQTVLQDHEGSNVQTDATLFEQLSIMIADILGACLTNLPRVMTLKCFYCVIEKREKSVLHAAQLLGETEEILNILQQHELPSLNPDKLAYIDEWRDIIL